MNVKLSYLYRDGGNYKNRHSVVFSNQNSVPLIFIINEVRKCLIDGLWFYANKWQLPDLHFVEYNWDSTIDHDWHEFECVKATIGAATEKISIEDFLSHIREIKT